MESRDSYSIFRARFARCEAREREAKHPLAGPRLRPFLVHCGVFAVLVAGIAIIFCSSPASLPEGRPDRNGVINGMGGKNESDRVVGPALLPGHTLFLTSVLFSPDGRRLASCGWDRAVRIWDLARLALEPDYEPTFLLHDSARLAMAFSADGGLLAVSGHGSTTVWSCKDAMPRPILERKGATDRALCFSPDGRLLAVGGDDCIVHLLDVPSGATRFVLQGHSDAIRNATFTPDGRRLITSTQNGEIVSWDPLGGTKIKNLRSKGVETMQAMALSPDGRFVAISGLSLSPRDVLLIDSETGVVEQRLTAHTRGLNAIAYAREGHVLATAGADHCIRLWDSASGRMLNTFSDGVGWVRSLTISPDGKLVAYVGDGSLVRVWTVPSAA